MRKQLPPRPMPNSTKSKKLAAAKGPRNLWRRGFAPEGRMPDRYEPSASPLGWRAPTATAYVFCRGSTRVLRRSCRVVQLAVRHRVRRRRRPFFADRGKRLHDHLCDGGKAPLVTRRVGIVSAGYWPWRIITWRVISTRGGGSDRGSTDRSGTNAYRHSRAYAPVIATPVNASAIDTSTVDTTAIICRGFS